VTARTCPLFNFDSLLHMSKSEETNEVPEPTTDIFSDVVALSKSIEEIPPSEQIITSLVPRKPRKDEFVRCHPELRVSLNIYEDKPNRIDYVLVPEVLGVMNDLVGVKRIMLTLTANYTGDFFAWPVPIPADVGANRWHSTAYQGCEQATRGWIRIKPSVNEYLIYRRTVEQAKEPVWPSEVKSPQELVRLSYGPAGGGDVIASLSHEVVRRLKGEI